MSSDNLSSVSQNVLKFYQQLTSEERSMCVLDTIYGLVTKKIVVGNIRKIIVTPKEDNLFLYIII
jgi:uncharacterized membrane protein